MKNIALAAALLLLSTQVAFAADRKDGDPISGGTVKETLTTIGGSDGAAYRLLKMTNEGWGVFTEAAPRETDAPAPYVSVTNGKVFTGLQLMGTGWTAYPYQMRGVYISRTTATGGGNVPPTRMYLFTSDDSNIWTPVGGPAAWGTVLHDSTKVDTLVATMPSVPLSGSMFIPIPTQTYGYLGKYLAIFAVRDSTTNTPIQTLTIAWFGRKY